MQKLGRVLVVDDDDASRMMLAMSLRREGYEVEAAAGGGEALSRLSSGVFDWLITDCRMRPMDGYELAAQAQRVQPRLRVVMVSALNCVCEPNGVRLEDYLCKPVPMERLLGVLSSPPAQSRTLTPPPPAP